MAVVGEGVAQVITHHHEPLLVIIGKADQAVIGRLEGAGAVVIIGVDDGEGRVNQPGAAQHGMAGAPGLHTALGHGEGRRKHIDLLEGVAHLHGLLNGGGNETLEVRLNLMLDQENDPLEACAVRVEQAVMQDGLPAGAHGIHLLQPTVAAAHARSHDQQNRFFLHMRHSYDRISLRGPRRPAKHTMAYKYPSHDTANGRRMQPPFPSHVQNVAGRAPFQRLFIVKGGKIGYNSGE